MGLGEPLKHAVMPLALCNSLLPTFLQGLFYAAICHYCCPFDFLSRQQP